MISRIAAITTADQLLALPDDDCRHELVEGVLKSMAPAGSEHGKIAGRIFSRLHVHVETRGLGETYAAETGFKIHADPDTVRAPDAAFVSHARLAAVTRTRGYLPLAPDLVVEVISPGDSFSAVEAKTHDWLRAGSRIVLIADPANECLHVHSPDSVRQVLRRGETFHAGDVCGDWQLAVDDVFQSAP